MNVIIYYLGIVSLTHLLPYTPVNQSSLPTPHREREKKFLEKFSLLYRGPELWCFVPALDTPHNFANFVSYSLTIGQMFEQNRLLFRSLRNPHNDHCPDAPWTTYLPLEDESSLRMLYVLKPRLNRYISTCVWLSYLVSLCQVYLVVVIVTVPGKTVLNYFTCAVRCFIDTFVITLISTVYFLSRYIRKQRGHFCQNKEKKEIWHRFLTHKVMWPVQRWGHVIRKKTAHKK